MTFAKSEKINAVRAALLPVIDPELGISVVDLGLVRGIDVHGDDDDVQVYLTLTSPMCPMGPQIIASVKNAAEEIPWTGVVDVQLVWKPVWDPKVDANEEVRAELGLWL
jgi:metal-sulfur cluster biosynthetic enzyme